MGFASQFLTELCCQQGLFYMWHLEKNIIWRFQLVTQINCQVWLLRVAGCVSSHYFYFVSAISLCAHDLMADLVQMLSEGEQEDEIYY